MILGTAQLGMRYGIHNTAGKPDRGTAFQILDYAWKHGVAALDTAGAYGDSQELIGSYQELSHHNFRICTKTASGTAQGLADELEESLRTLRCGRIWLYYLHRFDACKNKDVMREMGQAKAQGKISNVGISVYEPKELAYIVEELPDWVDVVQIPFSLLDHARWQESDLLRRAKEKGIRLFARSIFLQGLLFQEPDAEVARLLSVSEALRELRKVAAGCSMCMQQLAVSFVLGQPYLDEILLGCETVGQLGQNMALVRESGAKRLPEESIRRIGELSASADALTIDPREWGRVTNRLA